MPELADYSAPFDQSFIRGRNPECRARGLSHPKSAAHLHFYASRTPSEFVNVSGLSFRSLDEKRREREKSVFDPLAEGVVDRGISRRVFAQPSPLTRKGRRRGEAEANDGGN